MKMMTIAMLAAALSATFAGAVSAASCKAELGATKSAVLVDRCTEVSPATHPPCNSDNPCDLLISEIKRGCGLLAGGQPPAPAYCKSY